MPAFAPVEREAAAASLLVLLLLVPPALVGTVLPGFDRVSESSPADHWQGRRDDDEAGCGSIVPARSGRKC